jgi:hypothetical protein
MQITIPHTLVIGMCVKLSNGDYRIAYPSESTHKCSACDLTPESDDCELIKCNQPDFQCVLIKE